MASESSKRAWISVTAETVATLAVVPWLGGLIALGAIAAPEVFGRLERETAGSLMGPIFRNFDTLVIVAALVFAAAEIARVAVVGARGWLARVRLGAGALLVACGLISALWLGPQIGEAFDTGVRRDHTSDAGRAMDTAHRRAELAGKTAIILGASWLALGVAVRRDEKRPG